MPPDSWIAFLECVDAAESGLLDLDGGAPEVVALAEHLVDRGLLRVPRAGCYALTPAGREIIAGRTTSPRAKTPSGTARARSLRPAVSVSIASLVAIALALAFWLGR